MAQETDLLLPHHHHKQANNAEDSEDDYTESGINILSEEEEGHNEDIATSVFSKMKHSVRASLHSQSEAVRTEYQHVKHALTDHLHVDDDFFLEMSLARNFSLLPSKPEVIQAAEEFSDAFGSLRHNLSLLPHKKSTEPAESQDDTAGDGGATTTTPPLSAYVTLACAVCALSSIGPFLAKQQNVDATLKIVWRFQGTALLLSPLAMRSLLLDGVPKLTALQWGTFLLAAASYAVLCVAFAMSINYTSVATATILTNSQSVLLVAAKLCIPSQRNNVVFLEVFGVITAFLGAVLCARESAGLPQKDAPADDWQLSLWGDLLGIISSIGGIGYIVLGKSLRSFMSVLIFMVLNMTAASFMILFYMWIVEDEFSFDRNVNHGVFGWMNLQADRLPLEIATVVVCNCLGTMGYVRAFQYFSSVIIAVAALLEPVVAAFTAVALGVGVLPGVEGWIGNVLVIFGTLAVLYPTIEPSASAENKERDDDQDVEVNTSTMTMPPTPYPTPAWTPYPRMRSPRLKKMNNMRVLSMRNASERDQRFIDRSRMPRNKSIDRGLPY